MILSLVSFPMEIVTYLSVDRDKDVLNQYSWFACQPPSPQHISSK